MGGRGAFLNSAAAGFKGIAENERQYSVVDKIGNIEVVQWDYGKNNQTITFSNTPNTTYFSLSKERYQIERIYYYRNHKLFKSVDFPKNGNAEHAHYWKNGAIVKRKKHDKKNIFELNTKDRRLYNEAVKWNNEHRK